LSRPRTTPRPLRQFLEAKAKAKAKAMTLVLEDRRSQGLVLEDKSLVCGRLIARSEYKIRKSKRAAVRRRRFVMTANCAA